jgi:hypothetical protein
MVAPTTFVRDHLPGEPDIRKNGVSRIRPPRTLDILKAATPW